MLKDLKSNIADLSHAAVYMAEDCLKTSTGQEKKKAAVNYVVSMLPISSFFKALVSLFLSKFIDESVENAVRYMNTIKNG